MAEGGLPNWEGKRGKTQAPFQRGLFCVPRGRESTLEAEGQRSRASAWGWGPMRSKESREPTLEAEKVPATWAWGRRRMDRER